ncbi:MAG TPA: CotH kinase family protein [Flavobacteriales bacterium]|nr:CotH kinase family protein [Flavobacteriales bacterium]
MKKEAAYLFFLLVFSTVYFAANYVGVASQPHVFENIDHLAGFVPHNCYKIPLNRDKKLFYSNKGHFFKQKGQGNLFHNVTGIDKIPTSPIWKTPSISTEYASLAIFKKKGPTKNQVACLTITNKAASKGLPVVSLIINPSDFFSNSNGIYVQGNKSFFITRHDFYPKHWTSPANYFEKSKENKRKGLCTYYDSAGEALFSQTVDVSIAGNATRYFPQKSLHLKAGKKKGKRRFAYDVFGDSTYYSSMVLRNGGNDGLKTLISDGVMQQVMQHAGLETLPFKLCTVYINGLYWGVHSIRTRSDEKWVAEKRNIKSRYVTFMENWELKSGKKSQLDRLLKVVEESNNPSLEAMHDISEQLDMDNFVKYLSAQIFFCNTDWPSNNIKAFKIQNSKEETKWRFIFFDLDYGMGYTGSKAVETDMIAYLKASQGPMGTIFRCLMTSGAFRLKLKQTLVTLMKNELSENNLCKTIDNYVSLLRSKMTFHLERWRKPVDVDEWQRNVNALKAFAHSRINYINQHIAKHLK